MHSVPIGQSSQDLRAFYQSSLVPNPRWAPSFLPAEDPSVKLSNDTQVSGEHQPQLSYPPVLPSLPESISMRRSGNRRLHHSWKSQMGLALFCSKLNFCSSHPPPVPETSLSPGCSASNPAPGEYASETAEDSPTAWAQPAPWGDPRYRSQLLSSRRLSPDG